MADCRYDVLLGMPCQTEKVPKANYSARTIAVEGHRSDASPVSRRPALQVTNIGVKKFGRLLRSGKQGVEVYQVVQGSSSHFSPSARPEGPKATLLNGDDPDLVFS